MERNRLETGNVNVGRPAVLFLNQDKAGADTEKMTGQCSPVYGRMCYGYGGAMSWQI